MDNDSPTTVRDNGYPATKMIWSEDEREEDSQSRSSEPEQALNVTENESPEKLPLDPLEPAELKQAEIIFVGSHKPDVKKPRKPSSESKLEISVSEATTEKRQQQKHKKKIDKIYLSLEDPTTKMKEASKRKEVKITPSKAETKKKVEKKVHTEEFSLINIWDDIINNKPIESQAHSELSFKKLRKANNDENLNEALKSRGKNIDGALAISKNDNQVNILYIF